MASTNFVNYSTIIQADWLNDVNNAVYNGNFQATTLSPVNVNATNLRGSLISPSVTLSGFTIGQIPYANSAGLLQSSSNLTFNGTQLTVQDLVINGTLSLASLSLTTPLSVANGGTGNTSLTGYVIGSGTNPLTAVASIPNTDITGLGTMSTQNSTNVTITGGAISGVTLTIDSLDGTPIGSNNPSSGAFTTLGASSNLTFNSYNGFLFANGSSAVTASPTIPYGLITGLGTMAIQSASSVNIIGGAINGTPIGLSSKSTGDFTAVTANALACGNADITGGSIDATPIGNITKSTGKFTTIQSSALATLSSLNTGSATITGGIIDGTPIGNTVKSTGKFTSLTATSGIAGGGF
jgi:hypothetical protein